MDGMVAGGCRYFDLFDAKRGELTEWGRRIWEEMGASENVTRLYGSLNRPRDEILEDFCERHGITDLSPVPESQVIGLERWIKENDIPKACPYEPYGKAEMCIFHLSPERRDALDVASKDVKQAFLAHLRGFQAGGESTGQHVSTSRKCFVGAKLERLDLRHEVLEAPDNHPIDFRLSRIGRLQLDNATVSQPLRLDRSWIGDASFRNAEFSRVASFRHVDFRGRKADFTKARFVGDEADFSHASFGVPRVSFEGATFQGGEARFAHADFGVLDAPRTGKVTFHRCKFVGGDADFSDATFGGPSEDTRLRTGAGDASMEMSASQADGMDVEFARAEFSGGDANFTGAEFLGKAGFESVEFARGCAIFAGARFRGSEADFADAEFTGEEADLMGARFESDDADFSGTWFDVGEVTFARALFRQCNVQFEGATFGPGIVDFSWTSFDGGTVGFSGIEAGEATLEFRETRTDGQPIDMTNSVLGQGIIEQPKSDITVYDLEEAEIGDVVLEAGDGLKVFDCFRFLNTDFNGFDFSRYNDDLSATDWIIHKATRGTNRPGGREATEPEPPPGELEATYMKAKIGADRVGHAKATAEFFQRELLFRREKKARKVKDPSQSPRERVLAGWRWTTNTLLWLVTGYGERPFRVIGSSIAVVGLFVLLFQGAWSIIPQAPPPSYEGMLGALLLSFESFTTLVLGGGNVDTQLIRFIGYVEGFIGAFLIALFVFTITRSIRR